MASSSIRTEMTRMVSILLGQEEEMMQIGSNKKETRTGPETLSPTFCASCHTTTINAPMARVTQTNDDENQRQLQNCDMVMRKQTGPGGGWIAPVEDDPKKLQIHPPPNPESTEPLNIIGTSGHDAPTQIHSVDRCEASLDSPKNAASPSIGTDAARDDQLPPEESTYEPATDRGNVVPIPTQLGAAMVGQPSPEWDSCEPGE